MHHSYNFQSFDYIVKLPDSISSTPFLLTGYTKPKDGGDSIEFILEQEGQTSYLEIETEEEEIELESGKEYSRTVRYAYHYKPLSGAENPFKKFPTKECITYHKQAWTLESSGKSLDTANYMDGETETYKVTYRYYHNNKQQLRGEESDLLCFTHEGDIKDFDVCYGTYIDTPYDICIYELTKA